ncbi:MAG: YbhB/YbcL family Raf kinase inhibitor-like protein [Bacteroidota bacterium]
MNSLVISLIAFVLSTPLVVKSPAFKDNTFIPGQFTCMGANTSPQLDITDIPAKTVTLVVIMDDPDAEGGTFDHWLMWNIPVTDKIEEGSALGVQGKNSKLENKYTGPCPPSGTHHYHFKVYALDTKLDIESDSDKSKLLAAMQGHILSSGELTGLYKK